MLMYSRRRSATTSESDAFSAALNARLCRAFLFMGRTLLFRVLSVLLSLLLIGGCGAPALQKLAEQLPEQHRLLTLDAPPFALLAAVKQPTAPATRLRVYIEGDGHAWVRPNQPSLDPTPRSHWFARLAMDDSEPAVWLGRPCQYLRNDNCRIEHWTDGRFSQEVISAMDQALTQLKQLHGSRELELVGYSGGAAVALLLAAQRDDVVMVQTLAGNLSPQLWTAQLGLSPLVRSLDPLSSRRRLQNLPQRHLVGSADTVVPPVLAREWHRQLGYSPCIEVVELPGLGHQDSEWPDVWRRYQEQQPQASRL